MTKTILGLFGLLYVVLGAWCMIAPEATSTGSGGPKQNLHIASLLTIDGLTPSSLDGKLGGEYARWIREFS